MSIKWGNISFTDMQKLSNFKPPYAAAVYVIMHEDPNEKNSFFLDYVGESANLQDRGLPWGHHKVSCFVHQAGGIKENVWIAIARYPGSSKSDRLRIEASIIETYSPHCND